MADQLYLNSLQLDLTADSTYESKQISGAVSEPGANSSEEKKEDEKAVSESGTNSSKKGKKDKKTVSESGTKPSEEKPSEEGDRSASEVFEDPNAKDGEFANALAGENWDKPSSKLSKQQQQKQYEVLISKLQENPYDFPDKNRPSNAIMTDRIITDEETGGAGEGRTSNTSVDNSDNETLRGLMSRLVQDICRNKALEKKQLSALNAHLFTYPSFAAKFLEEVALYLDCDLELDTLNQVVLNAMNISRKFLGIMAYVNFFNARLRDSVKEEQNNLALTSGEKDSSTLSIVVEKKESSLVTVEDYTQPFTSKADKTIVASLFALELIDSSNAPKSLSDIDNTLNQFAIELTGKTNKKYTDESALTLFPKIQANLEALVDRDVLDMDSKTSSQTMSMNFSPEAAKKALPEVFGNIQLTNVQVSKGTVRVTKTSSKEQKEEVGAISGSLGNIDYKLKGSIDLTKHDLKGSELIEEIISGKKILGIQFAINLESANDLMNSAFASVQSIMGIIGYNFDDKALKPITDLGKFKDSLKLLMCRLSSACDSNDCRQGTDVSTESHNVYILGLFTAVGFRTDASAIDLVGFFSRGFPIYRKNILDPKVSEICNRYAQFLTADKSGSYEDKDFYDVVGEVTKLIVSPFISSSIKQVEKFKTEFLGFDINNDSKDFDLVKSYSPSRKIGKAGKLGIKCIANLVSEGIRPESRSVAIMLTAFLEFLSINVENKDFFNCITQEGSQASLLKRCSKDSQVASALTYAILNLSGLNALVSVKAL